MKKLIEELTTGLAQWILAVFAFDFAHKIATQETTYKLVGITLAGIALVWSFVEKFVAWKRREAATPTKTMTVPRGLPLIILFAILATTQGCLAISAIQQTRERLAGLAFQASYEATLARLNDHDTELAYFLEATDKLNCMANTQNYDPVALATLLRNLPIHEFRGKKASLLIARKVAVWQPEENVLSKVDKPPKVKSVLYAISLGISKAVLEFKNKPQPHH